MTKTLADVAPIGGVAPKPEVPKKVPREDQAPIVTWHAKPVRSALKQLAAEQNTTVQKLMAEAINMLFLSKGKGPIA